VHTHIYTYVQSVRYLFYRHCKRVIGDNKMSKRFLIALVTNFSLLIAYEVFYSAELLEFAKKIIQPDSISLLWTPIFIAMPFGTHSGTIYGDGIATISNLTFFILLGIICFNLYVIRRLETKLVSSRED
jgi:hypothetical protein